MVDFIFVIIALFFAASYGGEAISRNLTKSAFFEGGWFERKFQTEGDVAHQPLFMSENCRVIALLCGIKITAVHCLALSQSMHVTYTRSDRRTDRITTLKTALA